MCIDFRKSLFATFLAGFFALSILAQEPSPTPPDEAVKILTEEVHLNVSAQDDNGKFVPTLTKDDLLIVESGDPQTITSMRRVPANILLLLDTGGNLTYAKNVAATGVAAKVFVKYLSSEDTLAVMQYNDKIETISDWTDDFNSAMKAMDGKLLSGKRSRFSEALNAADEMFKSRPLENRHLVLISDGVETVADNIAQQTALQNLLAANITVHVISYTQLEEQRTRKAARRINLGDGKTKPRIPPDIFEMIFLTDNLTFEQKAFLKVMNEAQRIVIVNLDNEMLRTIRSKREEWQTSEIKLQNLAENTGGIFQAPEEYETMLRFAAEIAAAVDSNYVITYTPKRPIADAPDGETRKVRVSSHRAGVRIKSRQKIIVEVITSIFLRKDKNFPECYSGKFSSTLFCSFPALR